MDAQEHTLQSTKPQLLSLPLTHADGTWVEVPKMLPVDCSLGLKSSGVELKSGWKGGRVGQTF